MKRITRTKMGMVGAAVTVTALLGVAVVPAAQAADQEHDTRPAATRAGIPAAVDPATDLAAHTPGPEAGWNDSIYFTSEVKAGGHDLGLLVHTMSFPNLDKRTLAFSVTDKDTGWYKNYETTFAKDAYTWSTSRLDIKTPGLTWTGDARKMSVRTTTPWGSLNVKLKARGPVMKYAGTGSFPLLGDTNYEFALPSMQTTGTLTVQGRTQRVSGESWLDRQWGPIGTDGDPAMHWTWMNLSLPGGDKLALWDTVNSKTDNSWATVLHPDGSYDLAPVTPLADGAHRPWASPTSGNTYPTRWTIDIPALKSHLSVRLTGTDAQELTGGMGARIEATASFTGTYQGKKVTGNNYVEMAGNWKA
ncbi:lipocalin family protein [Streptomyces pseudovenezuelae]|uniref:lipocalin family protein n=1 Tax=Streptomyces pseudovenezuelae TaxID=67350 RepID=UPI002E35F66A|nr:lipocalin family protein [Streptomyces pseudovenezuelae]